MPMWHRAGATGLVFGLSGCLSFSRSSSPLVCGSHVIPWEGAGVGGEARLRAAHERVQQRANEGQSLPRSFGCARAGARRPGSPSQPTQESAFLFTRGRLKAWKDGSEPPLLCTGSFQGSYPQEVWMSRGELLKKYGGDSDDGTATDR
jgi:hypothetical protein